jgi:hypothetical protein
MELPFRVPPSTSRGPRALSGGYMARARSSRFSPRPPDGRPRPCWKRRGTRRAYQCSAPLALPRRPVAADQLRLGLGRTTRPLGAGAAAGQTSHAAEARGCGGSRGSSGSGCRGQASSDCDSA